MRRVLIVAALALAGCMGADEPVGSVESGLLEWNSLGWTAMKANWGSLNRLLVARFAQSPDTATLADTQKGQQVLKYVAFCALGPRTSVTIRNNAGVPQGPFTGFIGLAPAMTALPPTLGQQRWIVGCMEALENAFGLSIQVSLRGANAAYQVSQWEAANFAYWEGCWFGDNEFKYGCTGANLDGECGNSSVSTLAARACGDPANTCGITIVGSCAAACGPGGCVGANNKVYSEVTCSWLQGHLPYACVGQGGALPP